jgi:penicillin-binding protein 1C
MKSRIYWKIKLLTGFLIPFILFLIYFIFCLPSPLFLTSASTIVEDEKGDLLGARIANDGQWRFPHIKNVPEKFTQAVITFEDKNFYKHAGVDFLALGNAALENIKAGKVVRGGSTLSMQVIRLSRKNRKRTYFEKLIESIQALRLEISYSKEEILRLYVSEAPFGGNVVGLEAASWRYFGRPPHKLSWAESATLAVLPNSPSLIRPGKNQEKLKGKRDRLLWKLKEKGLLDEESYQLALTEPLPGAPHPLPHHAPHFITLLEKKGHAGKRNISTLNGTLQKRVTSILNLHSEKLEGNGIRNAAAIVIEVESGKVLAYCGNIVRENSSGYGSSVDIIQSPRSTGSILKPLLYAMILDEGRLLSKALVADIPTIIGGYAPKNFYLTYDGAVSFQTSISRSLNVPAVRLLQDYGIEKFHSQLKKLGVSTLSRPASHYGLSIILGGAEGTLWDLTSIYRNLAWSLNHYHLQFQKRNDLTCTSGIYLKEQLNKKTKLELPLSPSSVWLMMEAMNEVSRPEEELSWRDFISSYKIAWKTGTSYGFRDGWAIGCTPSYVVGVWVGNADGEGRPELTGISTAAPIMFDIFKQLKSPHWFMQPFNDMKEALVCRKSGYKAGEYCEEKDTVWVQKAGINSPFCPFHKLIFLDKHNQYRVNDECEAVSNMTAHKWFILPPSLEYYYKNKNSSYKSLPPYRQDCRIRISQKKSIDILYPQHNSKIYIPVELDGKPGRSIFEVAHREQDITIFWYLDNFYLGSTKDFHQMAVNPEPGWHKLTITDEYGESKAVMFEVLEKKF